MADDKGKSDSDAIRDDFLRKIGDDVIKNGGQKH